MKFEERKFNDQAMSHWLDDAVDVLDSEGLPMSCEAVKQIRVHVKALDQAAAELKKPPATYPAGIYRGRTVADCVG